MSGIGSPDGRHRELREELDRLRLENQRLHAELAARSGLDHWLRSGLAGARAGASRALRRMRRALGTRGPAPARAAPPYRVRVPPVPAGARRPRVLHVIGNLHLGGSARLVVDLVEGLGARYQQAVLTRDLPPVPAYTGLEVLHRDRLSGPREAAARLREWAPDFLHVHYLGHHRTSYSERDWRWYHQVFQAAERAGIPVVENVNIPTEPYVSDAVRCYVYVSDYVRERFGRLDRHEVTIHPGSDLALFRRGDLPVPDDTAGMVYRLEGDKLDERSIDPFVELVRRRPRTRALVVGGGRFLEPYRDRAAEAGVGDAFDFTGYVPYDELPSRYAEMSVFVAPVHRESFGQVSAFAMGMEVPVVGYRVGALPEIVGDPGLLAEPGDAAGLARIAADLLDDRERRLRIGAASRERALRLFSVEAMVGRYEALYDAMVSGAAPRGAGAA